MRLAPPVGLDSDRLCFLVFLAFADSPQYHTGNPDKPFTAMDLPTPHYLLFSQVDRAKYTGHWHFVLRPVEGGEQFEATDREPGVQGERLDLLCVVRALESLDQPSRVTLVDCSDYVWKGVQYGLPEWRGNGWRWEFFGQMVPVKNGDLWQRLDQALQFHRVECRRRRFDPAHRSLAGPTQSTSPRQASWGLCARLSGWLKYAGLCACDALRRRIAPVVQACRSKIVSKWNPRTVFPWL
jgi:ribonuclease HI